MHQTIFESSSDMMQKQIETVREKTIQKLAPLCPDLYDETFALMFANAWHEGYAGIRKIANDLDIYKLEIFAIERDVGNFNYEMDQEEYLKLDGDY
jgi:hypothetical protein